VYQLSLALPFDSQEQDICENTSHELGCKHFPRLDIDMEAFRLGLALKNKESNMALP